MPMSAKFKLRVRRLMISLNRVAANINPLLLVIAVALACTDASIFVVINLYGGPYAVMPLGSAQPAQTALDAFSPLQ